VLAREEGRLVLAIDHAIVRHGDACHREERGEPVRDGNGLFVVTIPTA